MFSIVIGGEVLLGQLLLASAFRLAENRFGDFPNTPLCVKHYASAAHCLHR